MVEVNEDHMLENKAQGQTLGTVGFYLPQPVFVHGQLYIALSRCTNLQKLKVLIENSIIVGQPGCYTRNIVFKMYYRNKTKEIHGSE